MYLFLDDAIHSLAAAFKTGVRFTADVTETYPTQNPSFVKVSGRYRHDEYDRGMNFWRNYYLLNIAPGDKSSSSLKRKRSGPEYDCRRHTTSSVHYANEPIYQHRLQESLSVILKMVLEL